MCEWICAERLERLGGCYFLIQTKTVTQPGFLNLPLLPGLTAIPRLRAGARRVWEERKRRTILPLKKKKEEVQHLCQT
jgi:hypothetical protein